MPAKQALALAGLLRVRHDVGFVLSALAVQ